MLAVVGIMIAGGRSMESLIPARGAFVMAAVKLLPSANRIVAAVNQIAFYEPALDNLLSNTEQTAGEEKFYTQENGKPLALKHEIKLAGISYTYPGGEKKIFDHADLTVPVGSSVGIVGTSGSGKTTAVDILLGLLKPQAGSGRWRGRNHKHAGLACLHWLHPTDDFYAG